MRNDQENLTNDIQMTIIIQRPSNTIDINISSMLYNLISIQIL